MINWPSMFPEWTQISTIFSRYSNSNWPIWFWQNHLFSRKILWQKIRKPISKIMVGHGPNFQKWLLTDQFQKNGWPPTKIWKMVAHQPISKRKGWPPTKIWKMVAHQPISKIMVGHRPKFRKWLLTDQFQKFWLATDQIQFDRGGVCTPVSWLK